MPPEHKGRRSGQGRPAGVTPQDNKHNGGDDPDHADVDEPEQALPADHCDAGDGRHREQRPGPDRPGRVVTGREVDGEHLGQVPPLSQEDHHERGHRAAAAPHGRPRGIGLFRVVPAAEPVLEREAGPGEECQGDREFHGPMGKDLQEQDTYGGGDHHVHGERRGRAEPDGEGTAPGGHDQGGEHGLVGQFAEEDHGEDRGDDGKVHAGPFLYRFEGQSASRNEDPPSSRPRTDP